jgi:hypothetical protein
MQAGRLLLLFAAGAGLSLPAGRGPHPVFERSEVVKPVGRIDEIVFADLKRLNIEPARMASDAVFLRRVYLDVTGTLPTEAEARSYLSDSAADRRERLVDALLNREEFAAYMAMKWADVLRIKAEYPINLWPQAAELYHRWVRTSLRENKPYDRFVFELLTSSGSNFLVPQVNFYRAVQAKDSKTIARAAALTFLGQRAEKWPARKLDAMAGFFASIGYKSTGAWKEEIVYFDQPAKAPSGAMTLPDGSQVRLSAGQDPREAFAKWLVGPGKPLLARAVVNRIWAWLLGRGIVQEPDDMGDGNPPVNAELLAHLERELIGARFDLKHVYRLILNSSTYKLSSIPASDHAEAAAHFAHYPVRRLEAEALADALCQITGTSEQYQSAIPEPYTVAPEGTRSVALPDGSITSSFLDLFGRPARDTGFESERNNRITAAQRLHMLNSSHVQRKIENGPALRKLLQGAGGPQELINSIYLTVLSRKPSQEELREIAAYSKGPTGRRREAVVDLVWALINSTEFLYRH